MLSERPCPVIWLSSEDWSAHSAQASFHITSELSSDREVLYCNSIGIRRPTLTGSDLRKVLARLRRGLAGPRRVADRLWVLSPVGIPASLGRIASSFNAAFVTWQIRDATRRLGVPLDESLFWTCFPAWSDIIRRLQVPRSKLVLHFFDRWEAYAHVNRDRILGLRRELVANAGAIFAAGEALVDELRRDHPAVHHAVHGVQAEAFSQQEAGEVPDGLQDVMTPIVGFFGTIDSIWLDFKLLNWLARVCSDISFLMIGQIGLIESGDRPDFDGLRSLANVHFTGPVEHSHLPALGSLFDVGLLPFRDTPLTRSASPLKLLEYLALGVPVVSTVEQQYGDLRGFVDIAGSARERFHEALMAAVGGPVEDAAARRRAAARRSWKAVVPRYLAHLREDGLDVDCSEPD